MSDGAERPFAQVDSPWVSACESPLANEELCIYYGIHVLHSRHTRSFGTTGAPKHSVRISSALNFSPLSRATGDATALTSHGGARPPPRRAPAGTALRAVLARRYTLVSSLVSPDPACARLF